MGNCQECERYSKCKIIVDRANFKMLRLCGIKPFNKQSFRNKELFKAMFGYALDIAKSIKKKDGTRLLLPRWKYEYIKAKRKGFLVYWFVYYRRIK